MGRVRAILQSEFPYNISARCINRDWFALPMEEVWQVFEDQLSKSCDRNSLVVHSFVLMSNHFHLLASTPNANISESMHQFMYGSSRELTRRGNRINETFAGRHYKCVMQSPNYFLNAYKYNYRNPVQAGICKRVEDYRFSTLQSVVGSALCKFPVAEDATYLSDPTGTLAWLNAAPEKEKLEAFRCGTHRQYFKSKISRTTRRPILGPNDTL